VADDCPVAASVVPPERGDRVTVARLQYDMLVRGPRVHTQEDILFASWLRRQPRPPTAKAELAKLRDAFFARPQACLRASPLPKKHGWGLVFDHAGKVALCAMESAEYRRLLDDRSVEVLAAMRSARAR
jgi:hypothetical protein